ncbi:hypothetical protein EMPS_08442 [Entomortierella parvispora]|uniref:Uncharacterized protein n=1 Tax=Entomortierella parvispora TaxID=205924 RepID=A0A9P3HGN8_9FUNG|nr:hypothetical protein EMPS_08442 [Entomortierella parvispora]
MSSIQNGNAQHRLNPFELLEISCLIQSYLQGDIRAVLSCCLVSKSFNRGFQPLLWESLSITPCKKNQLPRIPSVDVLEAKKDLVKSIKFDLRYNPEDTFATKILPKIETTTFPHLKRLHFSLLNWTQDLIDTSAATIYNHQRTLEELELRGLDCAEEPVRLWRKIFGLEQLRKLGLRSVNFIGLEQNSLFWRILTSPSLREVCLNDVCLIDSSAEAMEFEQEEQQQHQGLRHLTVINMRCGHIEYRQFLRTLVRFTNLTLLVSHMISGLSIYEVYPLLRSLDKCFDTANPGPYWKHLTTFSYLDCVFMDDEQSGSFLGSLNPGLKNLSLEKSSFGDISLQTLMQHHSKTLTRLNLISPSYPTGRMVRVLLGNCENLESLCGLELPISDLTRCDDLQHGRGCLGRCHLWVCTNLQEWGVDIDNNVDDCPSSLELVAFERLSTLSRLKAIILKPYSSKHKKQIRFQLGCGLEQLELRRGSLEELQFDQRWISREDWKWIIGTFKQLNKVTACQDWPRTARRLEFLRNLSLQNRRIDFNLVRVGC